MPTEIEKYRQFFDVDEKYFPCIDDSAIEAGAPWDNTYPHETFIQLLNNVEKMLAGTTKRSVWIHGAYGTGKSQCAYALKKILEVPEDELKSYWNKFDALNNKQDLLKKLLGHKERRIVTAYRYASGDITTPRDLFFAIQESIKSALIQSKTQYLGENTLKDSVIAWIEEPTHKDFLNDLLKKTEWKATFSQLNADEILNSLKKGGDIKSLMDNIFKLADKEGITAMNLDSDKLKAWIKDIIFKNGIKIVLVWDEFSGFFKQNRNSLDEFQKIVALCQEVPFYFIVVTHQTESIINNEDSSWQAVRQRFEFSQITLPDNIAFDLIGHAFNVKPAAASTWDICVRDLNARLSSSRAAVMKTAKISESKVIKDILPIHPMAALILKNIATAFKSNQRSMFDFIKTSNTDDVKAFQWFIETTGPTDDYPLLTVDKLWNFFYEKGRDNLTPDIRMILDTYPQQQNLREDEKIVLKAILIMQAISKRLGGTIDLLRPTEQNISYVFEGITSGMDMACKNLAKGLEKKGILVSNPIGDNKYEYGAAVLAGDQTKIDEYKKSVRQTSTTAKLVTEGKLSLALSLPPALRLRFEATPGTGEIIPVTTADFTRIINNLKDKACGWHFNAVVAFAKDDDEAVSLKRMIKDAVIKPDYKNIIFIDALSSPLGVDDFESYIDYSAMAQYYQGNQNHPSRDNSNKAAQVLSITWKNRIYNGSFIVYTSDCQDGERVLGGSGLSSALATIVTTKYKYAFDFAKGLSENQLKLTQARAAAKCGIIKATSGVVVGLEKCVLPSVWGIENYKDNSMTSSQPISIIKASIDKLVLDTFDRDGQVSISEIYNYLELEYGFAPCNLSAFLIGFLLRDYSGEPYRYSDESGGHEPMSSDKLAEMIGNYIGKNPRMTYIVKMTIEEKAFYELIEKVWDVSPNSCSSVSQASICIKNKMQKLNLPIWCLEEVDENGVYDIIKKFIELVQKEGNDAHKLALTIGNAYRIKPSLGDQLASLVSVENCQRGMQRFLSGFEGGALVSLANDINANDSILSDVAKLFSVDYSSLWNIDTGKNEIKKLIVDYSFVKSTNRILHCNVCSKKAAFNKWCEQLKFVMCSSESLQIKYPQLSKVFEMLNLIYQGCEILPEQMKVYVDELLACESDLSNYFNNELNIFSDIYYPYLEDLTSDDIAELKVPALMEVFKKSCTDANILVKSIADGYRKNQARTQLFKLWKDKTNSKNPRDWSSIHRTPILCLVPKQEYDDAKHTFDTLNRSSSTETEITNALAFLNSTSLFDELSDDKKINEGFLKILGSYKTILTDLGKVRDALDRLTVDAFDWDNHPSVRNRIFELAKAEYDAGGSDKAIVLIEKMDEKEMKSYLKKMIKENMKFGVEIINGGK